jgi:chitodextrinase
MVDIREMERMKNSYRCGMRLSLLFVGSMMLLLVIASQGSASSEPTNVGISVPTGTVGPGEAFTFEVYCHPGQPVRAFEVNFQFDPSLFEIITVDQGTLFTGYASFFSEGVIDNTEGTVTGVLGVILGSGNVTANSTLISVSCTAKEILGSSPIDLTTVGLTDETQYVSLVVNDGLITVASQTNDPLIGSPDPANGSTNIPLSRSSLSISIESPDNDTFTYTITTSPTIGSRSGIAEQSGTKSCSISGLSYGTTYHWYVCCRDTSSGNWTNRSFVFTTVADPGDNNNNGGGPPPSGAGIPFPDLEPDDEDVVSNIPPSQPLKPSGPVFIELGVEYEFTSSSFDSDGEHLRYRFDWGDGSMSSWSNYLPSNTSVFMSHQWEEPSNFTVRVIAQDEQGLNSSWSSSLTVIVSQEMQGLPPVPDIQSVERIQAHEPMEFNASGSIDVDGEIVSYLWDFGDGTTSTEVHPSHTFEQPGTYEVTLTVTDNDGNIYSKTVSVTVTTEGSLNAGQQTEETSLLPLFGICGILLGALGGALYYFRNHLHIR